MGSWLEAVKKVSIVLVKFDSLADALERVTERQVEIAERLARLEERQTTLHESARSAAQVGVHDIRADLIERITRLEMSLERYEREAPHARQLEPGETRQDEPSSAGPGSPSS